MKFGKPSSNSTHAIVFTDTHTDTQIHTHTHRHADKIAKPSFSDSGRCKTSRFVKMISIFCTITILPLYEKVKMMLATRILKHPRYKYWVTHL